MRKVNFGKMLVAFAMLLAVGMFAACSSSDDNNGTSSGDSGKTDPTPTPTITSGTVYVIEIAHPNVVKWADCYCSIGTSSSADNYKEFSSDSTSLANVKNAKLASVIKETMQYFNTMMKDEPDGLELPENSPVRVDSISLSSIPSTLQVKYKYGVKPGFDPKDETQRFTYVRNYCVIDNLGNVEKFSDYAFYMDSEDLTSDNLTTFLENLTFTHDLKLLLSDAGRLVVRDIKK